MRGTQISPILIMLNQLLQQRNFKILIFRTVCRYTGLKLNNTNMIQIPKFKLTCAIPDPMSPPPTTVTVLMACKDTELEKLLENPINLFIFIRKAMCR